MLTHHNRPIQTVNRVERNSNLYVAASLLSAVLTITGGCGRDQTAVLSDLTHVTRLDAAVVVAAFGKKIGAKPRFRDVNLFGQFVFIDEDDLYRFPAFRHKMMVWDGVGDVHVFNVGEVGVTYIDQGGVPHIYPGTTLIGIDISGRYIWQLMGNILNLQELGGSRHYDITLPDITDEPSFTYVAVVGDSVIFQRLVQFKFGWKEWDRRTPTAMKFDLNTPNTVKPITLPGSMMSTSDDGTVVCRWWEYPDADKFFVFDLVSEKSAYLGEGDDALFLAGRR